MANETSYPFESQPQDAEKGGFFSNLKEFSSNPDYVVKEGIVTEEFQTDFEEFRDSVGRYSKMIKDSKTDIKRFVPDYMLVHGKNDADLMTGFIVMEKVHGDDINTINRVTAEHVSQLEDLVLTSLDFFEEDLGKHGDRGGHIPDIWDPFGSNGSELTNIMIGTTKSDPNEKLYFVDINPLLSLVGKNSDRFNNLKEALENFSKTHKVEYSQELRNRLVQYGTKIFEPYKKKEYTLGNAEA